MKDNVLKSCEIIQCFILKPIIDIEVDILVTTYGDLDNIF